MVFTSFLAMINIFLGNRHLIRVLPNFVTDQECDHILLKSLPTLAASNVVSNDGMGMKHEGRTGSNTWLPTNTDSTIQEVADRLSEAVGIPLENSEDFQVVHYTVGQQYDYHFDSFNKDEDPQFNDSYMEGGQRIMTALGFLNDVPKGGETGFRRLGINFQPKKGTVIIWYNVKTQTTKGEPLEREPLSEHAGLPVLEGQKYAFNLWFRENKFPR